MLVKILILSLSVFSMLALGLNIKKSEIQFQNHFKFLILALVLNFFVLPFFSFVLLQLLNIEKDFASGLFLCAASSAGASSALFLLRANADLTLGGILSIFLNFSNAIFTPLIFSIYLETSLNLEIQFFLKLFLTTFLVQILPILIGFVLQKILADKKNFYATLFEKISKFSLIAVIIILAYQNFSEILKIDFKILLSAFMIVVFSSYIVFIFLLNHKIRNTISMITTIRSLSLALLLAETSNLNKNSILSILIYGLFMFSLGLVISKWIRLQKNSEVNHV